MAAAEHAFLRNQVRDGKVLVGIKRRVELLKTATAEEKGRNGRSRKRFQRSISALKPPLTSRVSGRLGWGARLSRVWLWGEIETQFGSFAS